MCDPKYVTRHPDALSVHWMRTECALSAHWMCDECALIAPSSRTHRALITHSSRTHHTLIAHWVARWVGKNFISNEMWWWNLAFRPLCDLTFHHWFHHPRDLVFRPLWDFIFNHWFHHPRNSKPHHCCNLKSHKAFHHPTFHHARNIKFPKTFRTWWNSKSKPAFHWLSHHRRNFVRPPVNSWCSVSHM